MGNSTLQFEISEMIPKINDLTQKEINFINRFYNELNIDFEGDKDMTIYTDPEEFGCFLVYCVRRYLCK